MLKRGNFYNYSELAEHWVLGTVLDKMLHYSCKEFFFFSFIFIFSKQLALLLHQNQTFDFLSWYLTSKRVADEFIVDGKTYLENKFFNRQSNIDCNTWIWGTANCSLSTPFSGNNNEIMISVQLMQTRNIFSFRRQHFNHNFTQAGVL